MSFIEVITGKDSLIILIGMVIVHSGPGIITDVITGMHMYWHIRTGHCHDPGQ